MRELSQVVAIQWQQGGEERLVKQSLPLRCDGSKGIAVNQNSHGSSKIQARLVNAYNAGEIETPLFELGSKVSEIAQNNNKMKLNLK
jgi:hypothetical protein